MTELVRLAWSLAPAVLGALLDLLRASHRGASPDEIHSRAQKLAHVIAFEAALRAARRG